MKNSISLQASYRNVYLYKIIGCLFIISISSVIGISQGGFCTATSISPGDCNEAGSISTAFESSAYNSSCSGTESAEGWYWITGASDGTQYTVSVTGDTGEDMVLTIYGVNGISCTSAGEVGCVDDVGAGQEETISFTYDTGAWDYYYVNIYEWWGSTNSGFTISMEETGSGTCSGSSSTCSDGVQNGDETGIDCGGSVCPPCGGGGGGPLCTGPNVASDDCINAPLVSFTQPYSGSTDCGFTVDEPYSPYGDDCGTLQNNSWISFIAATSSLEFEVTVQDIIGSSGDPFWTCDTGVQFSLWEGSCGNLSIVNSVCENPVTDPNVGETNSFVLNGMTPGNTYYLMIDGYAGEECEYTLDPVTGIVVCDNDLCSNAEPINCSTPNIINGIQCATSSDAPLNCGGLGNATAGVWYSFTGTGDEITLSTNNAATDFAAQLHVFEGTCGSTTCVSGTGNGTNTVTFNSINGTNYNIYVSGQSGALGIYEMSISCSSPPPSIVCGGTFTDSGGLGGSYNSNADPSTDNWLICPDNPGETVTLTFTSIDIEGTSNSTCWDWLQIYSGTDGSGVLFTDETISGFICGTTIPGPFISFDPSGCLYITFESDNFTEGAGWEAQISCAPCPAPSNDVCGNAIPLTVNSTCMPTSGSTECAFDSEYNNTDICSGDTGDFALNDVWYSFVATSTTHNITATGGTASNEQDIVVSLYTSCGGPSLECQDDFFTGGQDSETINATGLTIGQTYYIRIYTHMEDSEVFTPSGEETDITVCVVGVPPLDPPCDCTDPICGGMHWDCSSDAENAYNDPFDTQAQYDIDPNYNVSNGATYELCYNYTSGPTETSVGFVHALGYEFDGFSDECTFDRVYHVYEAGCATEIASSGSADFSAHGQEYTLSPSTTYSFCVDITITSSDCLTLADTWVYLYNANGGSGGCGTCTVPCTEPGMGSVATYPDRNYQSCWTPECDIYGPGSFTNCFEAVADGSGFLGFANQIQNSIPGCINISWELTAQGDCANIIPNPTSNANGVGSGFNPEYTGLNSGATYTLCVTYDLPDFLCGLDGTGSLIPDFICIDSYGSNCTATLEGTSMDGSACQNDGIALENTISWNQTAFDAGPNDNGTATTGFLVFCDPPVLPMTEAYYNANALDAILETFDPIGNEINNNGDYVDPFNPAQVCSDQIYLIPITVSQVTGAGFVIDWSCFDTVQVVIVELGVPPMPTATADPNNGICNGDQVTLTATGGGSYQWSNGLGTNAIVMDSPTTTTTYTVTVTDDSGNCSSTAEVMLEVSEIMAMTTTPICNDGGTPTDPSDDTFTFNVTITGTNTSSGWTSDDSSNPFGTYGSSLTFGPYPISGGVINVNFTDNGSAACTDMISVSPPPTCSDDCMIMVSSDNIICNNNGTPSDDSDDTFTFTLNASGINTGASWNANIGGSGTYGTDVAFGPFNIADGNITITVTDIDDPTCSDVITIIVPTTCSSTCSISSNIGTPICNDNGTPSDPSDDTYTVEIMVTGANTGTGWTANDPNNSIGLYGVSVILGPYNIADGNINFVITDNVDLACITNVGITAPPTCSDVCEIMASTPTPICNDNGTPSDPSDDTYTFDITVTGLNNSGGWNANDPNTTTGSYNNVVTFGPYNIADGSINFTIIDNTNSGCTTNISVTPPATCSNQCEIMASTPTPICNDNGTPSDPSDDTYTFDITVTGLNNSGGWNANDPNTTTGSYDNMVTFGPYNIADGNLNFTITDNIDSGCTTNISVTPPATCSNQCEIMASVPTPICDDNGTPTDPTDDTYTFDITVTGLNTSGGWNANDPNGTSGTYGSTVSFGPYNIADGNLNFTITDNTDSGCTTNIMVVPPTPCSNQCQISVTSANIICNNNGTPSDDSDDTFTFTLNASGVNTGASWNADIGGSGNYGTDVSFGPFNIADGNITIMVTDIDDPTCSDVITITAPTTCSSTCSIAANTAIPICDDNGTPSDPSDDTYTFQITVTGANTSTGWTADDPNLSNGLYGVPIILGPYNISDGNISFTISDNNDFSCITIVEVTVPPTCSNDCDIISVVTNPVCNDNGSPSDPTDDTFTFDVTVSGLNTSGGWNANDLNNTTGAYNTAVTFGPYNIADGTVNFTIIDNNDSGCTEFISVIPPNTCSDQCDIMASIPTPICDDNGTPSDPSDDTFTFDITVTGLNLGAGWSADDPNNTSGIYNSSISFGPYNIANGDFSLEITDDNDPSCTTTIMIIAPSNCSNQCDINASIPTPICNDNGTPTDPSDDTFTFDITVTGLNTAGGWSANDPNGTSGTYGTNVSFGPYDIADGNLNFTISDNTDPSCTFNIMVTPPATCSDQCQISVSSANITCNNNGTPSDDSDDTFTFTLNASGVNTGGSWNANIGGSGTYGTNVAFGPFDIADGNISITVTDIDDPTCSDVITITAPTTCSSNCSISANTAIPICDNNGTPSDPSDDTYTFQITVTGANTGTGWTADDPNLSNGLYGVPVILGPYNISDGNISFTISDNNNLSCTTNIGVTAPPTCSNVCDITAITTTPICNDNGTPSDSSDDTFTFDVTVTGLNTAGGWTANDLNNTIGAYNTAITFGPYNITDGIVNFTIIDNNNSGCNEFISVIPPNTCSDQCEINPTTPTNIVCNDNGTPTDPSDDTYTFELTVLGLNTSGSWTANDPNNTMGTYSNIILFGPYNIADGILNFVITDSADPSCTNNISVTPPATCSDECDINATTPINILCNDNGTPTDPSDDTYTFELTVTGVNVSGGWTGSDPNGTSGIYGNTVVFGPYDIADGNLSFNITDNDDGSCSTLISVSTPSTCSNQCNISSIINNVLCTDNGTPTDPSDDTFTFDMTVNGTNSSVGWNASDPNGTTGTYGNTTSFGPYLIANGNLNITISDDTDLNCFEGITVIAPQTCSGTCSISNSIGNFICDDNGTPSDPDDDTFTLEINVTGSNFGTSWTANDPLSSTGSYDNLTLLGPYPIANGDFNFLVSDIDDPGCATVVSVIAPPACSSQCEMSAQVNNILCNDNGTPSDPSDDTFTFDAIITGNNTAASWTANDILGTVGSYNSGITFGPYLIVNGNLNIIITDANDPSCTTMLDIIAPQTCSNACFIQENISDILCDDNGTPSDPSDDTFSFQISVSGNNTGLNWTADDPLISSGSYNANVILGPYSITSGDLSITLTDIDDPLCTTSFIVQAPTTCSDACNIDAIVDNIVCDDSGTPSDPSDDTFSFDIIASEINGSGGWTGNDPNNSSGIYGNISTLGPYPIAGGPLNFSITDLNDANCNFDVSVLPPTTCSSQCEITSMSNNILCNDNGTPTDPSDDTFTFDMVISGLNTGFTWTSDDPNIGSGSYDVSYTFGPYLISNGPAIIQVNDDNNSICGTLVNVAPPNTCSGNCSISNSVSNIQCNDNGTPTDPSDDTFSFELEINGSNTAVAWTSNDPNGTSGAYGQIVLMGPYSIASGALTFTVTDQDDNTCISNINVVPPSTCSNDCSINSQISNINCNDNGTPTDASDDIFFFDIVISGSNNGSTWTANDPNTTSGSYDQTISFGPYAISDGDLSFQVTDALDPLCTTTISVGAPLACSSTCVINTLVNNILCDDNDTPSDPTDDTFTFDLEVTGTNTSSGWFANDINSSQGNYGIITNLGPYPILNGLLTFDIIDNMDSSCQQQIEITPPNTCSPPCALDFSIDNILCNDNGTPNDPSDDTFSYELTVLAMNATGGWMANDPLNSTGVYNVAVLMGPYSIGGGDLAFTITDNNITDCKVNADVTAPMTCSGVAQCFISASQSNIICDDNGSPNNPSDDLYTFDLLVTGMNTGSSWIADDPLTSTGDYGNTVTMGPYSIASGILNISISDQDDMNCTSLLSITPPASCSTPCTLSSIPTTVQPLCADDFGSTMIDIQGQNGNWVIEWSDPSFTGIELNNLSPGVYSYTITDDGLCQDFGDIVIDDVEAITAEVTTLDPNCPKDDNGVIIIDNVSGGQTPYSFSIDGTTFVSSNEFENLSAGNYSISVQDAVGCTIELEANINAQPQILINIDVDQAQFDFGDQITLSYSTDIEPTDILSLSWTSPADLSCTDCDNPSLEILQQTLVTLLLTTIDGCTATAEILLTPANPPFDIYTPNVFSPNGDNINDGFTLFTDENKNAIITSLAIYDRWGELVFIAENIAPNDPSLGWDGTFKGERAASGVYVFVASIQKSNGAIIRRDGDVTLLP